MTEPQPFPVWIFLLFPLFFAAVWLLVNTLLATLGGWGELARLYRDPGEAVSGNLVVLPGSSATLRRSWMPLPVNYNRVLTLNLSGAGLHLRVMVLFRFLHPPLLIPWAQIERMEPGSLLGWRTLAIRPCGTGIRIGLFGGTARVVEESWLRRNAATGAAERPTPV